ncbi:MAG: glycosyltransferase family 4 protein [Acidimicrobiales bacterium]
MTIPLRLSLDASAVPDHPTGAGRYVLELASRLGRAPDVDLTLFCRRGDAARWETTGAETVIDQVPPARPVRLAWEQVELPRFLGKLDIDVHHAPHYTMPVRAEVAKVVTIHDMTFFDHPEWHERAKVLYFRRAIRLAGTRADALVTASAAAAGRIKAILSPTVDLHLIPHGVDNGRFHPLDPADTEAATADDAARHRMGLRQPYVSFVGTLEPRKDVPNLVRAFDSVADDVPDLTLVLAGAPGWGMEAIESAIASIRHRGRVQRVGYISEDDKVALIRGAASIAYPSQEEGFGLPVLEAFACGAPLVTTSGSAMAEVVDGAALLVRPGNTEELAAALVETVRGGAMVDERRRLGLDLAARYTWDASAAAHLEVFREVAARRPRSP